MASGEKLAVLLTYLDWPLEGNLGSHECPEQVRGLSAKSLAAFLEPAEQSLIADDSRQKRTLSPG